MVQVDALISESLGDLLVLDSPVLEDNTEPPLVSKSTDAKLDDKLLEMHYEFIKGFHLMFTRDFECDSSLEGWALSGFASTVRSAAVTLQAAPPTTCRSYNKYNMPT